MAAPKSECISKQGLLAEVEALNQQRNEEAFSNEQGDTRVLVIEILDFKAFYPILQPEKVAQIVKKKLAYWNFEMRGSNLEVSIFLTVALTDHEKKENE